MAFLQFLLLIPHCPNARYMILHGGKITATDASLLTQLRDKSGSRTRLATGRRRTLAGPAWVVHTAAAVILATWTTHFRFREIVQLGGAQGGKRSGVHR